MSQLTTLLVQIVKEVPCKAVVSVSCALRGNDAEERKAPGCLCGDGDDTEENWEGLG